jgi:hypothetical protein
MRETFKYYLSEAFAKKNMTKVLKLISQYLKRKVGEVYEDIEHEKFEKANGRKGFGIRFFDNNKRMIRFNWESGQKSDAITSVDVWLQPKKTPDLSINTVNKSIAKILPAVVQLLKMPKIGKINVDELMEDDKIDTSFYILEARKKISQSDIDAVIEDMKAGMTNKELTNKYRGAAIYKAKQQLKSAGEFEVVKGARENSTTKGQQKSIEMLYDDAQVYDAKLKHIEQLGTAVAKTLLPSLLIAGSAGVGKCLFSDVEIPVEIK